MKKILFFIFLFFFLIQSETTTAQLKRNTYTYQAAQVQFWYPNEWQIEEEDKLVTLQSMDGALTISFSIMQASEMEAALVELESIVQTQLANPSFTTEPEIIDLNGMEGVMAELMGTMDGQSIRLGVFIVSSPQNVLLILGMGKEEALGKYNKELQKIIKSIQPL